MSRMEQAMRRLHDRGRAAELSKWGAPVALIEDCVIPPLSPGQTGYVYVVGAGRRVKIGWSKDVAERVSALQSANPDRIFVFAVIPTVPETERQLHEHFAASRRRREWFDLHGPVNDWLKGGCPIPPPQGHEKGNVVDGLSGKRR